MDSSISFQEYLASKKIDADKFKRAESELYGELATYFEAVHPDSFTAQKLFLINPLRRKYLLQALPGDDKPKPKAAMKPKLKKP